MSEPQDSISGRFPHSRPYNQENIHSAKLKSKSVLVEIQRPQPKPMVRQLIQNFDITDTLNDQGEIVLYQFLRKLKQKYNMPIQNHQIFYYLHQGEIYMNCGNDPINTDVTISQKDYNFAQLRIKTKEVHISLIHKLMSEQVNQTMMQDRQAQEGEHNDSNKCRRTKQRRIGYIIQKVVKWRQLYTGIKEGPTQPTKRYSLEDAAVKVGISKKSLDDYLLQIRFGKKFGFNFNEHKNDKVGVLRDYVRKNKKGKPQKKPKKAGERKQRDSDASD